jgi:hypothetical protein
VKKPFNYLLFLFVFAVLGFSREFIFVNINNQLYNLYYNNFDYKIPEALHFIENIDYSRLYYSKYPLTILYFLAYLSTSYFAVKVLCVNKKNAKWTIYIYAILLALSSFSMMYNYFINQQLDGDEYTFSRWLMGIAQSPLVAFFTIASSTLYNKFQTEK